MDRQEFWARAAIALMAKYSGDRVQADLCADIAIQEAQLLTEKFFAAQPEQPEWIRTGPAVGAK